MKNHLLGQHFALNRLAAFINFKNAKIIEFGKNCHFDPILKIFINSGILPFGHADQNFRGALNDLQLLLIVLNSKN